MIQTDPTFAAAHNALQKRPLYFLEIDEVEIAWCSFPTSALEYMATGYGVQAYGMVGYGF
jgi:hypothetical protein